MVDQSALENDEPLLVAKSLSKSYGRIAACRDVSFSLYPGEVLAIVGESGSGKSTLLQLLSGQLAASGGHVSYRMRDGVSRDLAALGASCADSNCSNVDLPEPDSPTIASTSPG